MNNLVGKINSSIIGAMSKAEAAHAFVFPDKMNENLAAVLAAAALSEITLAEALYFTQHNGEDIETENVFTAFHLFVDELFDSVKTNHSHQHTDFYFSDLKAAYDKLNL